MAFTSLGVVLISTLTFVLGTFPEFQSYEESGTPEEYPEAVLAMEMIDNVLVGFFVIEYVVRFFFLKCISLQGICSLSSSKDLAWSPIQITSV